MKTRVLTWQEFWAKRTARFPSKLPYPVKLGIDEDSRQFESENPEWRGLKPNNSRELWRVMK